MHQRPLHSLVFSLLALSHSWIALHLLLIDLLRIFHHLNLRNFCNRSPSPPPLPNLFNIPPFILPLLIILFSFVLFFFSFFFTPFLRFVLLCFIPRRSHGCRLVCELCLSNGEITKISDDVAAEHLSLAGFSRYMKSRK